MALHPVDRAAFHARGTLISGAIGRTLRRATWAGALACGILAAVLGIVFSGWGVAGMLVASVLAALGGVVAAFVSIPARTRGAFETFAWLGRRELNRIREQTGAAFTGTTPDAAVRWLEDNPPSPVTALARVEVLAMLGRFDEAEAEAARLPPARDDIEAVGQALNRLHARFVADLPADAGLMAEVAALESRLDPASEAATELRVGRAIGAARERLAAGRADWDEPLLAVRPSLGQAPSRVLLRDLWSRLALSLFGIALALSIVVGLLPALASV